MCIFRPFHVTLFVMAVSMINSVFVVEAFTPVTKAAGTPLFQNPTKKGAVSKDLTFSHTSLARRITIVPAQSDDSAKEIDDTDSAPTLSTPAGYFLGVGGTIAAMVTFYSEFTLKTTGCGIPAGPFGLFGLIEGLSYLGVTGMAAYSITTKLKTGSGLPAGPYGLVGAAEGLSFLAIAAGLAVLVLQVLNYGYIPNAIPMEGGMCS
jgi:hypothetical protein